MFSIIFRGSGEIFYGFSIVFWLVHTCKKLPGKKSRKNPGTQKFDAKHSATVSEFPKYISFSDFVSGIFSS
jgi:hypothetical protein